MEVTYGPRAVSMPRGDVSMIRVQMMMGVESVLTKTGRRSPCVSDPLHVSHPIDVGGF